MATRWARPARTLTNFNHVIHFDKLTGARTTYTPGDDYMLGEAVFAPRRGATDEADGYLIVLAFHEPSNKSELLILDAQDVDKGPVARAKVPMRIPAGFHGSWIAAH